MVRSGIYLHSLTSGTLKECRLLDGGLRARADAWGCFTGSEGDDPDDERLRLTIGKVWRSGDLELRCDESEGWKVNRCFTTANSASERRDGAKEKYELAGSAWIDEENVFNICK